MKNKKITFVIVVFLAILFISTYFIIKEPFENEEDTTKQQINTIITQFSDVLCPAIKVTLDSYKIPDGPTKEDPNPAVPPKEETEEEKTLRAMEKFEKELGIRSFPCPPPEDPIQLPADIGRRIVVSLKYFEKKLPELKDQLVNSMNNCNPPKVDTENKEEVKEEFQDVCPPPFGKTSTPPPPPDKRRGCVNIHDIPDYVKPIILKQRLQTLSIVLKNEQVPKQMATVKELTQELLEAKKKAENLELTPNCPP
jgi:hypothetical protein